MNLNEFINKDQSDKIVIIQKLLQVSEIDDARSNREKAKQKYQEFLMACIKQENSEILKQETIKNPLMGSLQITIETLPSEVIDEVHQRINVKKLEFRNDSDSDRSKTSENEDNYFQTLFEENNEKKNNNKTITKCTQIRLVQKHQQVAYRVYD